MEDCKGVTIQAGDIVKVDKAFYKYQNGYFFVERDGTGGLNRKNKLQLHRISKFGQISDKKDSILYYPYHTNMSDVDFWNERYCTIEVVKSVSNNHVIVYFDREADLADFDAKWALTCGKPDAVVEELKAEADWYKTVCERLKTN